MSNIRHRRPADDDAIRRLNDEAFGGRYESKLVADLRAANLTMIELVATEDQAPGRESIVGHILFSGLGVSVDDKALSALALAPMSILPGRQRQSIGSVLVRAGLDAARRESWQAVIVLGHADFYPRFGFSAERARHLDAPFAGRSFMALDLVAGALDGCRGAVVYPAAFGLGQKVGFAVTPPGGAKGVGAHSPEHR